MIVSNPLKRIFTYITRSIVTSSQNWLPYFIAVIVFITCFQSFVSVSLASTRPSPQPVQSKHALILVSPGYGIPGVDLYLSTLVKSLNDSGLLLNNIHVEFLDLDRYSERADRQRLVTTLNEKYADTEIDLLFCIMQPALNFFLSEISGLASGAPVFCSFSVMPDGVDPGARRFIFQTSSWDFSGTLQLALQLFPRTERVIFIQGHSENELANLAIKRLVMSPWLGKIEMEDTQALSIDEIEAKFTTAPPNTLIIGEGLIRDSKGQIFVPAEFVRQMAKIANAPYFVLTDINIGYGPVGGVVSRFEEEALELSTMAVDILLGTRHLTEPITMISGIKIPFFDWQQLKRWDAKMSNLPANTVFINRPLTLWGQFKFEVIASTVLILGLVTVLFLLSFMNRRQKLTNAELQKSKKQYLNLVESTPDLITRVDTTGHILFVNHAALKIYGIPLEECVGRLAFDFIHPDDQLATRDAFQEWLKSGGDTCTCENRQVSIDGSVHFMMWVIRAEYDENGEVKGFSSTARDITDRKRAEETLRESEMKFRALFEQAGGYSMILDPNTSDGIPRIVEANDAACAAHGYMREEFIGRPVADINDEEGKRLVKQHTVEIMTGKPFCIEKRHVRKDGSSFHVEMNAKRIDIGGGRTLILTTEYDITGRKKAETDLLESKQELQNLIQTIQAGIIVYGAEKDTVKMFNQTAIKILRLTEEQLLGKVAVEPGWELISEYGEILSEDEYPVNIVRKTRKALLDCIVGVIDSSREEPTWVIMKACPQFTSKGDLTEIISSFMDITELKNTQSQLRKKDKQLIQAQKMESIGNLAGGIAHDFNNILSAIIGFTQLALESAPKGSMLRDDLDQVYQAGIRAKELVQQILAFARRSDENTKPIRVSEIVTEVIKLLRPSTPTTIAIKPIINSQAKIMGNASQLHQIVMNVCTNAVYSLQKTGGVLEIYLRDTSLAYDSEQNTSKLPPGKYVELAVTDDGPGIASVNMEKIFEPYFSTKEIGEGTGLGLAVVKGIIESYGGDIKVTSEPGVKTSFTVRLPALNEKILEGVDTVDPVALGTERILIVDDELPIARMGSRILENLGYKVTIRTSSFEALELFKEKPDAFDLVITDMTMPAMTGDVLSAEIRKIRQNIPIIICTGYSNKLNKEGAERIGINAFICKPFTRSYLAKTLREVLDTHRSSSA